MFSISSIPFQAINDFIGRRVLVIGVLTIVLGFGLFALELGLAFSLQAFLYAMGFLSDGPSHFQDWFPFDNLPIVLALFLVVGTLRGLGTWAQSYFTSMVIIDFQSQMRSSLLQWAFANRSARIGEVSDLFNDKIDGASNFISTLINVVSRVTVSALLVVSLLKISLSISSLVMVLLLLLAIPIHFINRKIRASSDHLHLHIAATTERLLLGIKNSLLLHIHATSALEEKRAQKSLADYRNGYKRYYIYSGFKGVMPFIYGIWIFCVIGFSARELDPISQGLLVSYLYLFLRFVQSLGELANLGSYLSLTRPRLKTIWTWWHGPRLTVSQNGDNGLAGRPSDGAAQQTVQGLVGWRLEDVGIRYGENQPLVLDSLNLTIEPGSTLVIKGRSGSGKSTLLGILLGMQSPTHGHLSVIDQQGGEFEMNLVRDSLLSVVGYVGPESFLIPGTVRDNLNYGVSRRYSDDDMKTALELAECKFVFDNPDGLDHVLTEQGEGLSAGQKQRLSLARAMLRKPKVLVLDEATANLDFATEKTLVETLSNLRGRMTMCIVTHRQAFDGFADIDLDLEMVKAPLSDLAVEV